MVKVDAIQWVKMSDDEIAVDTDLTVLLLTPTHRLVLGKNI